MKLGFFILGLLFLPGLASAGVVINEIAWMGMEASTADEWIELYNTSSEEIDLTGWVLIIQDKKDIFLEGLISGNSYYLIERTDDNSVPNIAADLISSFGHGISNSGETLILKNSSGNEIDSINASEGWPSGDNETKETMQKTDSSWLTGVGTPKAQNIESSEETNQEESSPDSYEYIPPENRPSIKAYAGEDKVMVVGALSEFRGMGYGFDNEPLENARYLWNFGDGTTKEGQNITHNYRYPGKYTVVLDISSGECSAPDILKVEVIPNNIFISEIKTGIDSFIEIHNDSKYETNLSGWRFRAGHQTFTFSKNTFIGAYNYLVIPVSSSGLILAPGRGLVEFLYPGGFLADSFEYNGFLKEGKSFSRIEEGSAVTPESPGEKNIEASIPAVIEITGATIPDTKTPASQQDGQIVKSEEPEETEEQGEKQMANVIATTKQTSNNTKLYFVITLGVAIFAGLSFFLIRRQRGV